MFYMRALLQVVLTLIHSSGTGSVLQVEIDNMFKEAQLQHAAEEIPLQQPNSDVTTADESVVNIDYVCGDCKAGCTRYNLSNAHLIVTSALLHFVDIQSRDDDVEYHSCSLLRMCKKRPQRGPSADLPDQTFLVVHSCTDVIKTFCCLRCDRSPCFANSPTYKGHVIFPRLAFVLISLVQFCVFYHYYQLDPVWGNLTSPLSYQPTERRQAWRFFTYALVHAGWAHLSANLVLQLIFGPVLEARFSPWKPVTIYLVGIITGALSHSVFDRLSPNVGASAGVYALIAAHVSTIFVNLLHSPRGRSMNPLTFLGAVAMTAFAAMFLGKELAQRYLCSGSRISFAAHLGGALSGVLLGSVLFNRRLDGSSEAWCNIMSLIFLLTFITVAICVNSWSDNYPIWIPQSE